MGESLMRKILLMLIVSGTFAICGCGSEPSADEQKKVEGKKPAAAKEMTKEEKLHKKARITEAASLVGYDGKKIRKDLDKFIDESAKQEKMLKDLDDM
jgi:uncharacterized protein YceK